MQTNVQGCISTLFVRSIGGGWYGDGVFQGRVIEEMINYVL